MKDIIIITGQTATGKTKLARDYALSRDGELINCDSRQIYKHLTIICGKDLNLLQDVRIWLYDISDPKKYFSSYDFKKHALFAIEDIASRNKIPIIVGGTYLYLKHLFYGIETETIKPDWKLRKKFEQYSIVELQKMLKKLSVQLFKQLNQSDRKNPQRLIRKIELATHSKAQKPKKPSQLPKVFNVKIIGLRFKNKESLRNAVEKRVAERIKNGAFEEVAKLLEAGYTKRDPGLKTIGYQQLIAYFDGKLTKDEAIDQWITKEIQYAKRQYTFMKKDLNIKWREVG
ncbi:tRNA (adenosine(37)-N6)-dimethylallyltransferase MiaA [Candidatus Roizmanbacteria bacterium]|nr:tRNA (adenosine(37)-N6)-dimethylallyltransferase MiaA [Candidatus Roizmanbacteria bacterium]